MATSKNSANSTVTNRQNNQTNNTNATAGLEDFIYTVVQRYVTDMQAGKQPYRAL